ncbi:MAG: hypothetical protein HY922_08660 [Elusimicrobia bacterium]|nr:hypothetical protein [Elusimicrobiota bacterium]
MRTLIALSAFLAALTCAGQAPPPNFGTKPFGVLLLTKVGGADWDKTVANVHKRLGLRVPLETVVGTPSPPDIRRALERLKAGRAEKIIVIPVYLHTDDDELDQLRYILGIRERPSAAFMNAAHAHMGGVLIKRAVSGFKKLTLVMTPALDADPALADVLLFRAAKLGREPKSEAVVLVGGGSSDPAAREAHRTILGRHVQALQRLGQYRGVRAVLVNPGAADPRDQTPDLSQARGTRLPSALDPGQELREAVRSFSGGGHVIVLPYLLTPDGTERVYRKILDNAFILWDGKGLLAHPRLVSWVNAKVLEGAGLPNMVRFRDEGKPQAPPERRRVVR